MSEGAAPPARGRAPSPCVGICTLEPSGRRCRGCLRTVTEIAGWLAMAEDERWEVIEDLVRRRAAAGRPPPTA